MYFTPEKTLMKLCIKRRLIWVCIVCVYPIYGTLCFKGLSKHENINITKTTNAAKRSPFLAKRSPFRKKRTTLKYEKDFLCMRRTPCSEMDNY